jgi:hypothetical protein
MLIYWRELLAAEHRSEFTRDVEFVTAVEKE